MDTTTTTAGKARCYERHISVSYCEEVWSRTCEKTTTYVDISGLPLIHSNAKSEEELFAEPDPYNSIRRSIEAIKALLVPPGQEVRLERFENVRLESNNWLQSLTFVTICDHGD